MESKRCKLCGSHVSSLVHEAEQAVLQLIKKANPDWVEQDGGCEECIKYYSNLDDAVQIRKKP